jgi:transcription elongation factor Elf1
MDKTPCLRCGRVGLVRFEVVVKGRETSLTYDCGYCGHTWQEADRRSVQHPHREGLAHPHSR